LNQNSFTGGRVRCPFSDDSRATLLEFALETREKIREVRAAVEFYERQSGPGRENPRAAAARGAIAGLRNAYRECRSTFTEADQIMIGSAEAILRKFAPLVVAAGAGRAIAPKAKRRR